MNKQSEYSHFKATYDLVNKALEELNLPYDTPCSLAFIAGLQFYEADELTKEKNGFLSQILLKREPKNPFDSNAIEVWVSNFSVMVGHIDRDLAEYIAPVLDKYGHINACVLEPYKGSPWTLTVLLYGNDIPDKVRLYQENPKYC